MEKNTQEQKNQIAEKIVEFYKAHSVKLTFFDVLQGSNIRLYRFKVSAGTRGAEIRSLENDLAISLAVNSVHFVIMDNKVCFEIPKENNLSDLIQSQSILLNDPMIEKAKEIIKKENKVSYALLQRKLSIGYGRTARIIDILEAQGLISEDKGVGKQREIYFE